MNKKLLFSFLFGMIIYISLSSAIISTTGSSVRDVTYQNYPSITSSDVNTYWPILDTRDAEFCRNRQDVLLQIAPAGCQPTVVRSDLLAEQSVAVMCQLDALQVNPLLDIQSIDSITFSGRYPQEVATTGFYPARAALSSGNRLLNNPLLNNVGYVVVVLKRQQNESKLPESVHLNMTARIRYDAHNALGVGQASFILPEQTENEFQSGDETRNSFWQGRYFIRADSISADRATFVLYYEDQRITTVTVERGKQSGEIFIPGMSTCRAAMKIAYDGFEQSGKDRARIEVQTGVEKTDIFDVYDGMSFYDNRCTVSNIAASADGSGSLSVSCRGNDRALLSLSTQGQQQTLSDEYLAATRQAIAEYKKVATLYSAEEATPNKLYGEQALIAALELAEDAGLSNEYSEIIALYSETYPDSVTAQRLASEAQNKIRFDRSAAGTAFRVDTKTIQVRVLEFIDSQAEPSVSLSVANAGARTYKQGDTITLVDNSNNDYTAEIRRITPENVIVRPRVCPSSNSLSEVNLRQGESATICGQRVTVQSIDSEKIARVRVIPDVNNIETVTNLSVNIGIEKRALQLSPEKATQMIDNLNESIKKWESVSKTLDKTVTGLKTACFATAAVLTAKNFVSGLDGTSLARKQVMQGVDGSGGWNAKCEAAFRSPTKDLPGLTGGPFVSIDDCLRKNGAAIDRDVDAAQKVIEIQNNRIESMEESNGFVTETQPFGSVVATDKSANENLKYLKATYSSDNNIGSIVRSLPDNAYDSRILSYNEMKELEYQALLLRDPGVSNIQKEIAQKRIDVIEARLQDSIVNLNRQNAAQSSLGGLYPELNYDLFVDKNAYNGVYKGAVYSSANPINGVPASENGKPFGYVFFQGKQYLAFLSDANSKKRTITRVYEYDSAAQSAYAASQQDTATLRSSVIFTEYDSTSYKNKYLNPSIKFHETEPYKGMPALVPVDSDDGWYVGTQQLLPALGQQATFQSNGRVSSFWLCNVGSNGLEEFEKTGFGDDSCQQFNLYSGVIPSFPGLTQGETQRIVDRAISRINQAAQQYGAGVREINLDGVTCDGRVGKCKVGSPAINVPAVRCQDYMSPKECLALFNVCDPVICPSSRCNLGGQYNVANVPETGIVGSALLCLPNAREGIAVPVCLTGIQAGVDGFVSVMRSHRDCLQEQLQTGRTVGICDQIYSVYMCEFFWRQVAPVANVLLPKIAESAYGQGAKGGGEYLTVMNAWQQTQQSVSYFTQQYAVNSIQAFKLRSLEEAGGEFCKAFASVKAPTTIKSLVEPDSPPQFHASFSSIKYSDATVPATSQYKVFYHIFAGNDIGVNYQVYLKTPTQTSFYNIPSQVLVASGFVTRGQYASQTRDFTAPEGYKELCVRVNDREECGFQQVSTSFALNYLTDQTRANSITQTGIVSASECTSGSLGTAIAPSLNIQSTVESAVNPSIYNQGIIRVCATNNPGSSAAPGRYLDVGYCDNERVRCWLDTESTARAITQENNGTRNSINVALEDQERANTAALQSNNIIFANDAAFEGQYTNLKNSYNALSQSQPSSTAQLSSFKSEAQNIIDSISDTNSKTYNNNQKAQLQLLRAQVFGELARVLQPRVGQSTTASSTTGSITSLTLDGALQKITTLKMTEDYGDNTANKQFVDQLKNSNLLSQDEYNEITGNGLFDIDEDLLHVQMLLTQKKALELRERKGEAGLVTAVSVSASELSGRAFRSASGSGSQIYIAGLPSAAYIGYDGSEQRLYIPEGSGTLEIGFIENVNGKNIIRLPEQSREEMGQNLYDLLNNAVIGTSTTVNTQPITVTDASKIESIEFFVGGQKKDINDLLTTDDLSLMVTHSCDNVEIYLPNDIDGSLSTESRPAVIHIGNLNQGKKTLVVNCYKESNVVESKSVEFAVKATQTQSVLN